MWQSPVQYSHVQYVAMFVAMQNNNDTWKRWSIDSMLKKIWLLFFFKLEDE